MGRATMYIPSSADDQDDECFKVEYDDGSCFKVSNTQDWCFGTESTQPVEGPPPELTVIGFQKVKDLIGRGPFAMYIIGWFIPEGETEQIEVIGISNTVKNDQSDLIYIQAPYIYHRLDDYDPPLSISECSLESFDCGSGVSNVAIRTSTEMVYIDPLILTEQSRTSDPDAMEHPFGFTDAEYWTGAQSTTGAFLPQPVVNEYYQTVFGNGIFSYGWTEPLGSTASFEELVTEATRIRTEGEWLTTTHVDQGSFYGKSEDWSEGGGYYYSYSVSWHWEGIGGSERANNFDGGFYTISKSISDGSPINHSGMNHFQSKYAIEQLPAYSEWSMGGNILYGYESWSGTKGVDKAFPSEVNLGLTFLDVRPNMVFGEGYLGVGANPAGSTAFFWEKRNGWYDVTPEVITPQFPDTTFVTVHRYSDYFAGHTNGTSFYLAPFTDLDNMKIQTTGDWIARGGGAISADYQYVVEALPKTGAVAGAIYGNRCLIPVESPTQDQNGNYLVIDQTFDMDEEKIPTRAVIFPA